MISRGIEPGSEAGRQMIRYLALLEKWNRRVNLTASTVWREIEPLFAEAIWASGWYPKSEVSHLDIGSGSGFPAIPMKILRPGMRLKLLESRTRRAAFLETVAAELQLSGLEVVCGRVEDYLSIGDLPQVDYVSWKGVKLSRQALRSVVAAGHRDTRFWVFQGREPAVEDPEQLEALLRLHRQEDCPDHPSWRLSIYRVR
jgi:16S rRNA (guanine(527)-N(7))-methyltransferase RsmG